MKVKMLEFVQGRDVSAVLVDEGIRITMLEPGDVCQVNQSLGAWLLEHNKAIEIKPVIAEVVTESEPEPMAEPESVPEKLPHKRGKR
jgi:hypothetical protein